MKTVKIKSFHAIETTDDALFDTVTIQGSYFTAVGIGHMSAQEAQLTDDSRRLFVTLIERCETSAEWAKECAFVEVASVQVAAQKVQENLITASPTTAIFFVCCDANVVHWAKTG